MVYPPASEVPVAALIRRGYDRAKGLGHGGLDGVRGDHRAFLAGQLGVEVEALPEPAPLVGRPMLVIHPEVIAGLYAPQGSGVARAHLMAALDDRAQLCVNHPWLVCAVEAFQRGGADARAVALWIAAMVVLPRWGAPSSADPEIAAMPAGDRAALTAALDAMGEGAVLLVAAPGALIDAASARGIEVAPAV